MWLPLLLLLRLTTSARSESDETHQTPKDFISNEFVGYDPNTFYVKFETPTESRNKAIIKQVIADIHHGNHTADNKKLSIMLRRYTCKYIMNEMYQTDFEKLVEFCQVSLKEQQLCLLRGLAEAMILNKDINDTTKIGEITTALNNWVDYSGRVNPDNRFKVIETVQHLKKHTTGAANELVTNFMSKDAIAGTLKGVQRGSKLLIENILHGELNHINLRAAMSLDVSNLFTRTFDKKEENIGPILKFISYFATDSETFHEMTQALIKDILIPYTINTDIVIAVHRMVENKTIELPDMKQDMMNETMQSLKQWTSRLPPSKKLQRYLSSAGFNSTVAELRDHIADDIQNKNHEGAKFKLFFCLSDIRFFDEIPKLFDKLNIDESQQNFDRLQDFMSNVTNKYQFYALARSLVMRWRSAKQIDMLKILQAEKIAFDKGFPLFLGVFEAETENQFTGLYDEWLASNTTSQYNPTLDLMARTLPKIYESYFREFLLKTKPDPLTILEKIENFNNTREAFLMYRTILRYNREHYDMMRLVFGLKRIADPDTIKKTFVSVPQKKLPLSAWNVLAHKDICLHSVKHNLILGVNKTANSVDRYRHEVGLFSWEADNIAITWRVTRPNVTENIYYIQNSEYKEYLIASVMDFGQDQRRIFTWRSTAQVEGLKWHMDLVGHRVIIKSVAWDEYVYGGKKGDKGVVYTLKNIRKTAYENQVGQKTGKKDKYEWLMIDC